MDVVWQNPWCTFHLRCQKKLFIIQAPEEELFHSGATCFSLNHNVCISICSNQLFINKKIHRPVVCKYAMVYKYLWWGTGAPSSLDHMDIHHRLNVDSPQTHICSSGRGVTTCHLSSFCDRSWRPLRLTDDRGSSPKMSQLRLHTHF